MIQRVAGVNRMRWSVSIVNGFRQNGNPRTDRIDLLSYGADLASGRLAALVPKREYIL
jgi:hypothetical protein